MLSIATTASSTTPHLPVGAQAYAQIAAAVGSAGSTIWITARVAMARATLLVRTTSLRPPTRPATRINNHDFCLCSDPSCSSSCPNYRSRPPPPPSSRRRSSSYSSYSSDSSPSPPDTDGLTRDDVCDAISTCEYLTCACRVENFICL
jgi:hypothetical protein